MIKKNGFKMAGLITLLAFALIFGTVSYVSAGVEPPPEGTAFQKGKIKAVATFVALDQPEIGNPVQVQIYIDGICMNTQYVKGRSLPINRVHVSFALPVIETDFPTMFIDSPASYLFQRLEDFGPPGCWSELGGETIWVTKVGPFLYIDKNLMAAKVIIKALP